MPEVKQKISNFFQQAKPARRLKGSVLIQSDSPLTHVYYLEAGLVGQYTVSKSGNKVILNVYKPGTFFPIYAIANQLHNHFFFEVISDHAVVYKMPSQQVIDFLHANSDVTFDLFKRLSIGMDGILKRLTTHMSGDARSRILLEILIYAERFGETASPGHSLIKLTEQQLASQTGLARETVSRELGKIDQAIIDRVRPKHFELNLDKLRQELSL